MIKRRYTSKRSNRKNSKLDEDASSLDKEIFEQCERYTRRGIVISQTADQMQSMVIQPDTVEVCIFRVYVHGKL